MHMLIWSFDDMTIDAFASPKADACSDTTHVLRPIHALFVAEGDQLLERIFTICFVAVYIQRPVLRPRSSGDRMDLELLMAGTPGWPVLRRAQRQHVPLKA
jgi:hypothetical protein